MLRCIRVLLPNVEEPTGKLSLSGFGYQVKSGVWQGEVSERHCFDGIKIRCRTSTTFINLYGLKHRRVSDDHAHSPNLLPP